MASAVLPQFYHFPGKIDNRTGKQSVHWPLYRAVYSSYVVICLLMRPGPVTGILVADRSVIKTRDRKRDERDPSYHL